MQFTEEQIETEKNQAILKHEVHLFLRSLSFSPNIRDMEMYINVVYVE